jgi:MFS family permease
MNAPSRSKMDDSGNAGGSAGGNGAPAGPTDIKHLRDLSGHQWTSGIAAWLGWLFDGLDMHLYTLVALPFVAQLLGNLDVKDSRVGYYGSVIQASFLVGWALGGGFFGRIGDRLGRARALVLTILTYALFTGLSFFAQTWWHLLICRFLAALGIGGEWAVGAALLSETWPKRWRPWIAATLQSAVNIGVLLATAAVYLLALIPFGEEYRYYQFRIVFVVGVLPALLVLWIRRAVPETEEWHAARARSGESLPSVRDLFRGAVRRTTVLTILVCSLSLSAHWAFMYWFAQHLRNLPDVINLPDAQKTQLASLAMIWLMFASIAGNYVAGAIARVYGYRKTIAMMCVAYFLALLAAYYGFAVTPARGWYFGWFLVLGVCQGLFGLFTMYLPPLFPTLLRTTGAGFCYNIGRVAAAVVTVVFGLFCQLGDYRPALFYAGFVFLPAAVVAMFLPEPPDEAGPAAAVE